MPNYILRDMPEDTWSRFKQRAQRDGWHLKALILQLLDDYGRDLISPTQAPTTRPDTGFILVTCPKGHQSEVRFNRANAPLAAARGTVACPACGETVPLTDEQRDALETWGMAWRSGVAPTVAGDVVISPSLDSPGVWLWVARLHQQQNPGADDIRMTYDGPKFARLRAIEVAAAKGHGRVIEISKHGWREIPKPPS